MLFKGRKNGRRMLSFTLILTMCSSFLTGCGNIGDTEVVLEKGNDWDAVRSADIFLANQSEKTEELIEEISNAIGNQEIDRAGQLVETLSEQLEETEEKSGEWLEADREITRKLSSEKESILEERRKDFEQDLEKAKVKVQETLERLENAMSEEDVGEAFMELRQLEDLLIEKEEPKTYGEILTNEVEVQIAGTEEYTKSEKNIGKAGEGNIAGRAEKKLLVVEGETALNDRIIKKAEELGNPLAIYNYLKNSIRYEYYYGSRKGAAGTLDAMGGNDFDQASILIAMLRYLGYPAEYVKGDILLTEEQAVSLTGAYSFSQAADVLAANGTPVTCLTNGEDIVYIRMEHVWVRAYVPYMDYRGAGKAGGDSVWIDLDTGIKEYEEVDNIYDMLGEPEFSQMAEAVVNGADISQIKSLSEQWNEKLKSGDFGSIYARKRIVRQKEVSYLPLSLQYIVEKESKNFAQAAYSDRDSVSFEINGSTLADFSMSDLQGKNVLLSFQPANDTEQVIYDSYDSIFEIPAYAVYMKPVLLVDDEVVAEGKNI